MNFLIILLLALFALIRFTNSKFTICSSINIQGPISVQKLTKIQNCTMVLGHIRILNAKFLDLNESIIFPHLIEITDYLLIFQVKNLDNLGTLFPKLTIIRGHNLFKSKALIVLMTNSLTKLYLKRLIHIDKGSILISRLYHACYINTIDWNYIIKNGSKPSINLNNNECLGECSQNCWSELSPQIKCSKSCDTNCDLESNNKCCINQYCSYCLDNKCISCSKFRDISDKSGLCVEKCPHYSLSYENSICIKFQDCSLSPTSLVKNYFVMDDDKCVKECPVGYKIDIGEKILENVKIRYRQCQKCTDEICKKDCVDKSFHITKKSDLNNIKNCYRVRSLILEIRNEINNSDLVENFHYLEEIEDYLIITGNMFLMSLNFLKNLKKIHGNNLFENKYCLFVHSNPKLRDLWPTILHRTFQLFKGSIKFFENPDLCYQLIENLVHLTNLTQVHESDISHNFNGYRRLTCSKPTIDLRFELKRKYVKISWNVSLTDLRRLKGFTIYYMTINDKEIDNIINDDTFERSEWQSIYIQYSELNGRHLSALIDTLKPFTRYAVYIKADLIHYSNLMEAKKYSSQYDKIISKINLIQTPASKPGAIEEIVHETPSSDKVFLKWRPPNYPNGIIEFYFISYTMLKDTQTIYPIKDRCSIEPSSFKTELKQELKKEINDNLGLNLCPIREKNDTTKNILESEQDEIISIEDEIFNLALRPVRRFSYATKQPTYSKIYRSTLQSVHTSLPRNVTNKIRNISVDPDFVHDRLVSVVKKNLFLLDEKIILKTITVKNDTLNVTLSGLDSFTRYLVSIIACQNFLSDFNSFIQDSESVYLPIEEYCSKPKIISIRSPRDESLDRISNTILYSQDGIYFFKWSSPKNPNGIILRYNIKFVDIKSNKTYGPHCHSSSDLKIGLNQFLLAEGRIYSIKVQIVTTAGYGPWSTELVKYKVPSLSDYYFRPDEWEIKRENLTIGERIGSGCFAEVHKGTILDSKTNQIVECAIKFCGSDQQNRQRLLKEANMLKSIHTTHIVRLLGVITKENPAYLILEYMENGDLKDYLKSFKQNGFKTCINTQQFYRMAAEIADGMLWLSEHKYIHRDLAARNCLISKENIIKISDLGLSKDIYQNPVYREKCKGLLPIRWMSPESLNDGSSTTKSDVWSYGVVIWEMATYGDNPYSGKENEDVIQFVKNGGRLELPISAPPKFYSIFDKCMITEDYKRICFKDILDILDPDLTCDFKQNSYYHTEFRKKCQKRKISNNIVEKKIQITIAEPYIGDSDNYM